MTFTTSLPVTFAASHPTPHIFATFPKTPPLSSRCVVTELLDGPTLGILVDPDGSAYPTTRSKFVTHPKDHFGFGAWVEQHADILARILGRGHHFGTWWGKGIGRGYGLETRRFSLLNAERWGWLRTPETIREFAMTIEATVIGLSSTPVLGTSSVHPFSVSSLLLFRNCRDRLLEHGSLAVPGYRNPKGYHVWHEASDTLFRVLL